MFLRLLCGLVLLTLHCYGLEVSSCTECEEHQRCVISDTNTFQCVCPLNKFNFPFCQDLNPCHVQPCGDEANFCVLYSPGLYRCACGEDFYSEKDRLDCFKCDACTAGQVIVKDCLEFENRICQDCSAGYFSNATNSFSCYECSPGKWTPAATGNTACDDDCDEGFACVSGTKTACSEGRYSVGGQYSCSLCGEAQYQDRPQQSSCKSCPINSTTVGAASENHDSLSDCLCVPGYTGSDGSCVACPPGHFKNTTGPANCELCDAGMFPALGQTTCAQCEAGHFCPGDGKIGSCDYGQYAEVGFSVCRNCPAKTWSSGGSSKCDLECSAGHCCPGNGTLVDCSQGTFSVKGSEYCTTCPANQYSTGVTNAQCQPCPSNSCTVGDEVQDHDELEDCQCDAGYANTSANGLVTCTTCAPGSYKSSVGFGPCVHCAPGAWSAAGTSACKEDCPAGAMCPGTGEKLACAPGTFSGKGAWSCTNCPPGNWSDDAAASCDRPCTKGHFCPGDGQMYPCSPGTFSRVGQSVCSVCGEGQYTAVQGASVCTDCPRGSTTLLSTPADHDDIGDCTCVPGYAGESGGPLCYSCAAGQYSAFASATNCTKCAPGAWSLAGASDCALGCPQGYMCLEGAKTACGAGYFAKSNASTCTVCKANTYSTLTKNSGCLSCPANAVTRDPYASSHNAISDCVCPPGFEGSVGNDCVACAEGYFKDNYASTLCSVCDLGRWSNVQASSCDLACSAGSFCQNGLKTVCPAGTFSASEASACTTCGANTYAADPETKDVCSNCPEHSKTTSIAAEGHDALTDCLCVAGTAGPAGGPCLQCQEGHYSDSANASACRPCANGFWSAVGSTSCPLSCEAGHSCAAGSKTKCLAGSFAYTGFSSCSVCGSNSFAHLNGSSACTNCPAGAVTISSDISDHDEIDDCYCPSGYWGEGAIRCAACAAGTYSTDYNSDNCTACDPGKWSVSGASSCTMVCAVGYACPGDGTCTVCDVGTFSPSGSASCELCIKGRWTISTGQGECEACPAGYSCPGDGTIGTCFEVGEYSPDGAAACSVCGTNSTTRGNTLEYHNEAADCKCIPGTVLLSSGCSPCPDGHYSTRYNVVACIKCPNGRWAYGGSTECALNCPRGHMCRDGTMTACQAGEWALAGAADCTVCEANQYNSATGSSTCTACPTNSLTSGSAARDHNDISDCLCKKGYGFADGLTCQACRPGTYKPDDGNIACGYCAPGKWSQSGAAVCNDDCPAGFECNDGEKAACRAGTYSIGGQSQCSLCPKNHYQPSSESNNCLSCPFSSQTTSSSNHDSIFDCICENGSYMDASEQSCKICPAGWFCIDGTKSLCDLGMTSSEGAAECTSCPPGTYGTENRKCEVCGNNRYSTAPGSTMCTRCPFGTLTLDSSNAEDFDSPNDCFCENSGYFYKPFFGCDAGARSFMTQETFSGDFASNSFYEKCDSIAHENGFNPNVHFAPFVIGTGGYFAFARSLLGPIYDVSGSVRVCTNELALKPFENWEPTDPFTQSNVKLIDGTEPPSYSEYFFWVGSSLDSCSSFTTTTETWIKGAVADLNANDVSQMISSATFECFKKAHLLCVEIYDARKHDHR